MVIAELVADDCDSQTDYFGQKQLRRVVIGFTKSSRSLFSSMRKEAATFEPTKHLAVKNRELEHREDYSGGGGLFLKDGWQHASGWSVRIQRVEWGIGVSEFSPALGEWI